MELFKTIEGYGEKYMIGSKGTVKSRARKVIFKNGRKMDVAEKVKSSRKNQQGVEMVTLYEGNDRKTVSVNKLVREYWGKKNRTPRR